jgi:Ca-activated chloride channel family protein
MSLAGPPVERHEEQGPPLIALGVVALMLLAIVLSAVAAAAAPPPAPAAARPKATEGTLLWRTAPEAPLLPAPTLATEVEIRVTGPVARARLRQQFTNPSGEWAEGVYVFPLPEDAAVDRLAMRVGDRTIAGVVRERAAARAGYEQARQEGRPASLVEQERANVFMASVANIAPGATVTVELAYQQTLRPEQGEYRLRFPMVVGPRHVPGEPLPEGAAPAGAGLDRARPTDRVPDAGRITPPVRHPARGPINPVRLAVELAAVGTLQRLEAPHHRVRVEERPDGSRRVSLDGPVPADRDFELLWRAVGEGGPQAALLAERGEGETHALLVVLPPAPGTGAPARPRELILVIDTSGSMHGASIEQARAALALALDRLGPVDHFNVIQFNSRTSSLFAASQPATPDNLATARRYVGSLRAQGGTEMRPALLRALDGRPGDGRLRQVVFLTDGAVGNEAELFRLIRERLGTARLFTIGIGSAPNGHFMREAARHGRGSFTYIGSPDQVRARMDEMLRRLEHPALTDLGLELPGGAAVEAVPAALPDLYLGEPVVVALRAAGPLPARAVLRGRLGAQPWRVELELREAAPGAGLARHWAREKIAALMASRHAGATEDEVRAAVLPLALRHHLVSAYTSLVAVDVTPARPGAEPLRRHAMATNLPAGWDHEAVLGLGQGASPAALRLLGGLAALGLAAACALLRRRRRGRRTRREPGAAA